MQENDAVIIAVKPTGFVYPYPIRKNGLPGVIRAVKNGRADVAVKRLDGLTERLLVPVGALRKA